MSATYLYSPVVSWHDEFSSHADFKAVFQAEARKIVVGRNALVAPNVANSVPLIGEGFEYGDHYYRAFAVGRDHTYMNFLGDSVATWSLDLKLGKFLKSDMSLVAMLDLTPSPAQLAPTTERPTPNFRECLPWGGGDAFSLNGIPSNRISGTGTAEDGTAVRDRAGSGDGCRVPGRAAAARITEAQGDVYGVLCVGGYAIPQFSSARAVKGLNLSDGSTTWERTGFSSYPASLASWHPNQDHDEYPWGTGFGANGLAFEQDFFSVVGSFGSGHIVVERNRRGYYPQLITDFSQPIERGVQYPAWATKRSGSSTVKATWEALWVRGFGRSFTWVGTDEFDSVYRPPGRNFDDLTSCGALPWSTVYFKGRTDISGVDENGAPVTPEPLPKPEDYSDHSDIGSAQSAITTAMISDLNSILNTPVFQGMRVVKDELYLEVWDATTGETVCSRLVSNGAIDTKRRVKNGPSLVAQDSNWNPERFGTVDVIVDGELVRESPLQPGDPLYNFWKFAPRPITGYIGGGEGNLAEGYGQFYHFVTDRVVEVVDPYSTADPPERGDRVGYGVRSGDAGACSGNTNSEGEVVHPSGITLFRGAGQTPTPTQDRKVANFVTTIYAPLAGGVNEKIVGAYPPHHSCNNYVESGNRLIFLARARTAAPTFANPGGLIPPASTNPDVVATYNSIVQNCHKIVAFDVNLAEGTIQPAWSVDTAALAGITGDNGSALDVWNSRSGDCPANGVVVGNDLWCVVLGAWGDPSALSARLVRIAINETENHSAGQVIETVNLSGLDLLSNTLDVQGEPLIVHNRRPTLTVKEANEEQKLLEYQ